MKGNFFPRARRLAHQFVEGDAGDALYLALLGMLLVAKVAVSLEPIRTRWFGGFVWIAAVFALALLTVPALVPMFRERFWRRTPGLATVGSLGVVALLTSIFWQRDHLAMETMREVANAVTNHRVGGGFAFAQFCHFRHACESMALGAFFTTLFGPSLEVVRATFLVPVLLGWVLFTTGLARRCSDRGHDSWAVAAVLAVASVYYVPIWVLLPEQSIVPFGHALLMSGLALHYLETRKSLFAAGLALAAGTATFLYVPALALPPLFLAVAFVAMKRGGLDFDTQRRLPWVAALIVVLSVLVVWFRKDVFHPIPRGAPFEPTQRVLQSAWLTLSPTAPNFGTWFARLAFPATLLWALSGRALGIYGVLVAAWGFAVVVFAVLLPGRSLMGAPDQMHRAVLILPVVAALAIEAARRHRRIRLALPRFFVAVAALAMVQHPFVYYKTIPLPGDHLVAWLEGRIRANPDVRLVALVAVHEDLWPRLAALRLQYLFPEVRVLETTSTINVDLPEDRGTTLLVAPKEVALRYRPERVPSAEDFVRFGPQELVEVQWKP